MAQEVGKFFVRILGVLRANDCLGLDGDYDLQTKMSMGLIPSHPMSAPYAKRWDKRDGIAVCAFRKCACGKCDPDAWIGEDSEGVWSRIHPQVALPEYPQLWEQINRWYCGVRGEVTNEDYERLSNFELEVKLTLMNAHAREESRQVKHGE